MKGTVLLAGVHGVGKTTASIKLTQRYFVPNYTASTIIKSAKNSSLSMDFKQVVDIDDNQRLLVDGIKRLLEINQVIILDGHFTLLNSSSKIEKIRPSVFDDLNVGGVILLLEEPLEIYNRLKHRDINPLALSLIMEHQNAELEHATYVTNQMNIPLKILENYEDIDLFIAFESLIHSRPSLRHR